jgi:hypothetical protein
MNTLEITRLLEKYYKGESTEDEELMLRGILQSENLPEEFEAEKELFSYYSGTGEIPEPSTGFEEKIIAAIDNNEKKEGIRRIRRGLLTMMSAAAGLLLLVGSYFFFTRKSEPKDTFSNPQIAYAETVRILYGVSSQLNRGTQALEPVRKFEYATSKSFATINKTTSLVEDNLKNLDYFQKVLNMVYSPMKIGINK